jgi:hypothetical protein
MPKIEQVTVTHDQLVDVTQRMHKLLGSNSPSQGVIEWALFRALSDELKTDLFELRPDECSCGQQKDPEAHMCIRCDEYKFR